MLLRSGTVPGRRGPTDNGSAFTARAFRLVLSGWRHASPRRLPPPESQAFIESWFAKLKQRCVWLHEFKTLDEPREVIGAHIDGYHHRPHSGLDYRTPAEVAQTWDDTRADPQLQRPELTALAGSRPSPTQIRRLHDRQEHR